MIDDANPSALPQPDQRQALVSLATEYWRILRLAEKAISSVSPDIAPSLAAQLRYSESRLRTICADVGMRLITYDREAYQPNDRLPCGGPSRMLVDLRR